MNNKFFIHKITLYHQEKDESIKVFYFDGKNLPKVYFRHNKKANVIDKRN